MENKNWPTIGVLIVIVVLVGAGIFFVYQQKGAVPGQPPNVVSSPMETIQATFTFKPEQATVTVGQEVTYKVTVGTTTALVSGVEAYMMYDPTSISIEKITPGSLFIQPDVLTNTVDAKKGTIWYAVGSRQPNQNSGEAIIITAKILKKPLNQANLITVDQNKSKVLLGKSENNKFTLYTETQTKVLFQEKPLTIIQ